MAIDAQIANPRNEPLSKAQSNAANKELQLMYAGDDYLKTKKPDGYIYVYNISEQTHVALRPPHFPQFTMKGKDRGEDYKLVAKLPQPLIVEIPDYATGEMRTKAENTMRLAQDICNPDNMTLDQNKVVTETTSANSNNLNIRGIFWSVNNPPTAGEVDAARQRMEKHYTNLLTKAETLAISNPAELQATITPEFHIAADYFGKTYDWHKKTVRPVDCELCGEQITNPKAPFHRMAEGGYCIKNYQLAYERNIITLDRVPVSKRWEGFDAELKAVAEARTALAK